MNISCFVHIEDMYFLNFLIKNLSENQNQGSLIILDVTVLNLISTDLIISNINI